MRYLASFIRKDLEHKMVLLAGPRQAGKTTLAKSLLGSSGEYLNWDILRHRKIIRDLAWPKTASLVVLDELHKAPKWKNFLKGVVDEFANRPPILVTGSARLDALRGAGDALTGRYYFYQLHPIDVAESASFMPKLTAAKRVERLLITGGFPEAFLNPEQAARLRSDRFELVVREDLRDLTKVTSWRGPIDLIELLRERIGKPVQFDSLSQDLGVSPPTVKSWVELLEKLYIVFLVSPFSGHLARSIRKEKRVFFYDCGAGENPSGRLENLVACSLLKSIQLRRNVTGEAWNLHYIRDKEKREVDFAITKGRVMHSLIEVKSSEDRPSSGLQYFHKKLKPKQSIQLVLNLPRPLEKDSIRIVDLASWLSKIDL